MRNVGSWKYYCNTRNYTELERVGSSLYVNGGKILYDMSFDSREFIKYDRINGLADFSLKTMKYDTENEVLVIAYENSMIDMIDFSNGKKIRHNFDIYNKLIVADKSVNLVNFIGDFAYIATNLGVVVLDYNKNEIRETYTIGSGGNIAPVYTIERLGDSIYASTNLGIASALINQAVNLQDYNNWRYNSSLNDTFVYTTKNNGKIYWASKHQLIGYDGSQFNTIKPKDYSISIQKIKTISGQTYIIYNELDTGGRFVQSNIDKVNSDNSLSEVLRTEQHQVKDIEFSQNNELYIVARELFKVNGSQFEKIEIDKFPLSHPYRIQVQGEKLFVNMGVMSRNLDANLDKEGMFVNKDGDWYQEGIWGDSLINCTNQISAIETSRGLLRAYVRGGISINTYDDARVYNESNTPLLKDANNSIRVSDMVFNEIDTSIWISSQSSNFPLISIDKNGKWYSHDISSVTSSKSIYKIVVDFAGNKWLLTRENGLIMFNEMNINDANDDIVKRFMSISETTSGCSLDLARTNDAVLDKDGLLWLAAGKGIGFVSGCTYDPEYPCEFDVPILTITTPNDTTRYTECAFLNTNVSAIEVDAGNRLWVGTSNGIFYTEFNTNFVTNEYLRLNSLNSPLSARSIYDIRVKPDNGEVYMSTEVGLLSYMGQSVEPDFTDDLPRLRVVPNPVPADYDGLIGIDGFPNKSYYKITDVMGNLMYQGRSNGSRVTWDGRTLNGNRVPTGVYYIFAGTNQLLNGTKAGAFTITR